MLPDKDGFAILEELKQNEELKNIPVIIITALGQESDVKKGLDMGAVDYLTKDSATVDAIVEKVEKHLGATPAAESDAETGPTPSAEAMPPEPQATGFCASCGAQLPGDAKFCPGCGKVVE